jgi:uncharacterized protein
MPAPQPEPITIPLTNGRRVSGLLQVPPAASAGFVFAHGAGAGMTHAVMAAAASGLAERGIATLRYQFPYMEAGSKRPDSPRVAHETVRAAVSAAARHLAGLPLIAGGKSYGARMTSQAQALHPLPHVKGVAFLGFPLHPAGLPSITRADHLEQISVPMLFLQGERDRLADLTLLTPLVERFAGTAQLSIFPDADHSFHVPKRSGRTDGEVLDAVLDTMAQWIAATPCRPA